MTTQVKATTIIDDSSSDDDAVILRRNPTAPAAAAAPPAAAPAHAPAAAAAPNGSAPPPRPASGAGPANGAAAAATDSDDDMPLAQRAPLRPPPASKKSILDDAEELPAAPRPKPKAAPKPEQTTVDTSDSDDDVPLAERRRQSAAAAAPASRPAAKKEKAAKPEARKRRAPEDDARRAPKRARGEAGASGSGGNGSELRWTTLEHAGVLFPPAYEPHGVQMLYDGLPVALTPEQEEVATFFAVMKDTDYMSKPTFLRNFWEGFSEVLGPGHVIRSLDKCDFTPIYEWHMAERERKRAAPKEVKDAAKREREAAEAKFKFAVVDGRREQVGNFRIEPPGLFRGRGEHPKMGRIKKRIFPRDVTINIGEGVPVPEHPFAGEAWREVRHDRSVTWLAYWRDPVNVKEYKYVFLAANSAWKSEGDLQKYEKARKLKGEIGGIRATYTRNWEAKERRERQMATALYFIDKLALRAGHEKDDDEADTVGCCTLKCENVEAVPPNLIRFDFLGKDSIRYENEVEVEARVFQNVAAFKAKDGAGRAKAGGDQLFDEFDATDLNQRLKELMEGLSVKVFRTFNASVTLDTLLAERSAEATVDGKKAEYDRANKEVAILCNHQRSESRAHTSQMGKMQEKLAAMQADLAVLVADHKAARAGKACADGRKVSAEVAAARVEKKRAAIVKVEIAVRNKEDLKTVALGTSKINYLDPRITVAWCKRNEVPLEKVFNKSLLSKFLWAMDVEPAFRF